MSSTTLPVCPKTGSTSPSLTVHLCLHTAPGNRECARSQRALGRDQIWFTEKNTDGATTLYSMAEFQPKGKDALGRRYLQGRYGGVPVLNPAEFEQAADVTGS